MSLEKKFDQEEWTCYLEEEGYGAVPTTELLRSSSLNYIYLFIIGCI